jgi:CheY-like chemotaxis protein
MAHIVSVSISKSVLLRYDFAPNAPAIHADAAQVRQIALNLITNASESIDGRSGVVSVRTGVVEARRADLADAFVAEEFADGPHVFLEVEDTGCGMDRETRSRLFDPFFTTKFQGRGLGLSAVLGIVRGHRGAIRVESEPGRGSRFRVLFPAVDAEPAARPAASDDDWRGEGTVLLADDEESVRGVASMMLGRLGYDVVVAEDGRRALEIFRERAGEISGVILDLTMPKLGGEECAREIRALRGDVPVILSSGYTANEVAGRLSGEDGIAGFLQKPYQLDELRDVLRRALG